MMSMFPVPEWSDAVFLNYVVADNPRLQWGQFGRAVCEKQVGWAMVPRNVLCMPRLRALT